MLRKNWLPILAAALLLGGTSLSFPRTDWDQSSATYLAQTILEGGAPYVDACNLKAPGVYFVHALSLLAFGKGDFGLRLFDLLWQTATALAVARLTARIFPSARAAWMSGVAYLAAYYSTPYWNWSEADGFLSLPLALGLLALLRALDGDRVVWWWLAAVGVGAATLIKLPFGLVGVAMLAAAVWKQPRTLGAVFVRCAALAVGVSLPILACGAYLSAKGSLDEFLATQLVLAPQFTARLRASVDYVCVLRSLAQSSLFPLFFLIALAAAFTILMAIRRERLPLAGITVALWSGVALLTVFLHGAYFRYHFFPLIAPAAVLAAGPIASELSGADPARRFSRKVAWACLILFSVVPLGKTAERAWTEWPKWAGRKVESDWAALAAHIRGKTDPRDRIFVWGNVPGIYLESERKCASRFIISYFLWTSWRGLDYRSIFLSEFERSKPRYVVFIRTAPGNPCVGLRLNSNDAFEEFTAFRKILLRDYHMEQEGERYWLYVRSTDSAVQGVTP
jgi:4-amino-4-deoxy-L-arabinose transferase-like glycosyltransferase